jgi:cell cycle sensor histidine kinase DivJ
VSVLASVRNYLDALVHPAARADVLTAARHRAFIAPRLIGGCVMLAVAPVYLAVRGMPNVLEVALFGWLIVPILLAFYLSQTGRYDRANILSAAAFTALVTFLASRTGAISSFASIWLVLVPLEAALSASRRVVATAAIFALGGAAWLLLTGTPMPPDADTGMLGALGVVSAALYGTGLALNAESLARTGLWLFYAEEDRYRMLARHMTDVISRHGKNGAVLFASPAAENLFGTQPNELMGQGLYDRVHVADRPAYLSALAEAGRGDTRSLEFRIRADTAGANFIWVEMRCRPLDDTPSDERCAESEVVAVLRDVSERKAHEAALEAARAEGERANAGKSRFLATMSHELRTPLNAIIGFSEMMTNAEIDLPAERKQEHARLINESGRHLLSVVTGSLDMSKMESGNFEITPEPCMPAEVVTNCCDILALKAQNAGVALNLRVPPTLPEVVVDRRAMSQILINLVSNAIKFTDRGGRVTVSASIEAGALKLFVEDTGIGIGAEDLPRLGEAFFQARASYDRRHDGTGLGLSIVKGLVQLHGGSTDIRSKLGVGTCVTVKLPLDCEGKGAGAKPIALPAKKTETPRAAAERQVRKSA